MRDCSRCGDRSALGSHRAYVGAGVVLRCPGCGMVSVRITSAPDRHASSSAAQEARGSALSAERFTGRTAWARNLAAPVRVFLRTETGSAAVLLGAALAALAWANVDRGVLRAVWTTQLAIASAATRSSQDLRHWVNNGLMALFFFVVGLEARREFDMGELRERRRIALPVLAALGG